MHDLAERLVAGHQARVVQHLVPEPRVEEMQHGVFGAADIQIHRHPVTLQLRIHQAARIVGIDEAQVVPARARPLRHGVGLAARRPSAGRIGRVQPVRGLGQRPLRRTAGPEVLQVRERQRQFGFRKGTRNAVHEHDRKRFAPVTLAAEQPVAQTVGDPRPTPAAPIKPVHRGLFGLLHAHAVQELAVDNHALAAEGRVLVALRRLNGAYDLQ